MKIFTLLLTGLLIISNVQIQAQEAAEIKEDAYRFTPAHPNPFYNTCKFTFQVNRTQFVKIEVLNLLGQRQVLLHEGMMRAGRQYRYNINAEDLDNSKIFFYKITGRDFRLVRKLTNYLKA